MLTLGMVTAFGVAPMVPGALHGATVQTPVTFPDLTQQIEQLDAQNQTFVHQASLQRGETVSDLLRRMNVQDSEAERFIARNANARLLLRLTPDQPVDAVTDQDGKLVSLSALVSISDKASRKLLISRNASGQFKAHTDAVPNDTQWAMRSGVIQDNFFTSMDSVDVPDPVVEQIIKVFSGIIDFREDVRRGDRFRLVYENITQQNRTIRSGRLLAVELVTSGTTHQAIWYAEPGGPAEGGYYTFDGKNLKQAFLRAPVEFSRISSQFGARKHPLHRQWKMHEGVDFAAPVGTRVYAASDGVVNFVGQQNGYGNIVILNHTDGYSTRYAHLSRFAAKLRRGQKVSQGQTIGYVGQTGWATGPHLHYELRYKGVPRNPLSTRFAATPPLDGARLKLFELYATSLLKRIDIMRTVQVAQSS